jgi:hypothetical protein
VMYGREKSDSAIVAMKPANKAGQPAAEWVERRAEAEGNMVEPRTRRTPSRESVSQGLERVRQAAKARKKERKRLGNSSCPDTRYQLGVVAGVQLCGSNSRMRLAGWVGSLSRMSLRYR